jgi:hypothetical protein
METDELLEGVGIAVPRTPDELSTFGRRPAGRH